MHRFHCSSLAALHLSATDAASDPHPDSILSDAIVELDSDESHHASRVLRLKDGDPVDLFDGAGCSACGSIAGRDGSSVTVRVESIRYTPPPQPRVDVAAAIPKGPRADAMVEQLSQLGADTLIPLSTERSVVHPRDAKLDRFQRAAIESAKQSGRAHVMRVEPIAHLADVLGRVCDLRLIATPTLPRDVERDVGTRLAKASTVLILIGPEGGFTEAEHTAAIDAGCLSWSLGAHIMRIETAAAAAAAIVRYLTMQ